MERLTFAYRHRKDNNFNIAAVHHVSEDFLELSKDQGWGLGDEDYDRIVEAMWTYWKTLARRYRLQLNPPTAEEAEARRLADASNTRRQRVSSFVLPTAPPG